MPSDIGRGIKFGIGFALGVGFIMLFFLFGISMCAGAFQRRMMEQMKEQMKEMMPPERGPEPYDDRALFQRDGQVFFFEARRQS